MHAPLILHTMIRIDDCGLLNHCEGFNNVSNGNFTNEVKDNALQFTKILISSMFIHGSICQSFPHQIPKFTKVFPCHCFMLYGISCNICSSGLPNMYVCPLALVYISLNPLMPMLQLLLVL